MDFGDMSQEQQTTFASPDVADGELQMNKDQLIRGKIFIAFPVQTLNDTS
jgi:hypothetical protein